jgi:hypothetical protein
MIGRLCVCATLLALVTAGGGTLASAAPAATTTGCGPQLFEQPFLRWLDPMHYVLAPDGAFEQGATGWKLSSGARVVSGNEPFRVRGAADARSLSLPSGSSATSPAMCIGVDAPTVRLFAVNTGSVLSTLRVDVTHRNLLGLTVTTPVGIVAGGSSWQPTLPLPLLANVLSLNVLANRTTQVSFRFTPQGSSGGWKIDDVYVDPFKGS